MKYPIGPHESPSPCGTQTWICEGLKLSKDDYDSSSCAKKPEPPKKEEKEKPIEVPGAKPGDPPVKCPEKIRAKCRSPKYRRLIPECKCFGY